MTVESQAVRVVASCGGATVEDSDDGDGGERGAEAGGELGDAEEFEEEGGDPVGEGRLFDPGLGVPVGDEPAGLWSISRETWA